MAKIINGDLYLSPTEASAQLQVSYKTLQRWADSGEISTWENTNSGQKQRIKKKVDIDCFKTPTGYRYYKQESIEKLSREVGATP